MSLLNVRRTGGENLAAGFPGSKKKKLKKKPNSRDESKTSSTAWCSWGWKNIWCFGQTNSRTLSQDYSFTLRGISLWNMSSVHHKDSNIFRSCKFHKKNPKHCIHTPNGFSRASEKCGSGAGGVGVVGVGGGGEGGGLFECCECCCCSCWISHSSNFKDAKMNYT